MQLLNSKILSDDKNTRYSNKKAQDMQYLVLFVCCSFLYNKDGGDNKTRTCDLLYVKQAL